ncbi:hypothetical protein [Roseivirga pacifica]
MKHTLINTMAILAIACLVSCSQNQTTETTAKSYKAVVADSLVFNYLAEVEILDYNELTNELLLSNQQTRELLVIDDKGNEISSFNPYIEGPNYTGTSFGWTFLGADRIVAYAFNNFHLLSKEGERIKRVPYPVEVNGRAMLDYNPKMILEVSSQNPAEIVVLIPGVSGFRHKTQAFHDSLQMVYNVNMETEVGQPVMHKTADGTHRSLGAYVDNGYPSMAALDDHKIAQMYHVDDHIYIWDASENKLLNKLEIPAPHKPVFDNIPFGEKGFPDRSKLNANIYRTKNHIVLFSMDVIPESVFDNLTKTVERWYVSDEYEQLKRQYEKTNVLLFSEQAFLGEVDMSEVGQFTYHSKESTNEDFFWVQRTYSDERDYRTFLKVAIVED